MKFFSKSIAPFEIIIMTALVGIYYYMTYISPSDIKLHAQFVVEYAYGNKPFQVNFLYYFTLYLFSFFSSEGPILLIVSVYLLAIITFLKYFIVKKIMISEISESYTNSSRTASIASGILLFCFSLPSVVYFINDYLYLLNFPPNVWHNSTTIFAMPFVVLLFWLSLQQLNEFSKKRLVFIGILIVLNVFAKPSFVFAYLAAYPLLLLRKYLFSRLFWINLIPIVIALLLIGVEYYFIYTTSASGEKNSVTINFFYFVNTWGAHGNKMYIIGILLSTIISSFLFPIVLLLRNKALLKENMIQFAILCTIISIVIANTLTETGSRVSDGNFLWQNYMSAFLLFFVCMLQLLKLKAANPSGWKAYWIETAVLLLHLIAGIAYFLKIYLKDSYY